MTHPYTRISLNCPPRWGIFCLCMLMVVGVVPSPTFGVGSTHPVAGETAVTVTGQVTDEQGGPLPGVNVLEKGTSNGTVTDVGGNYRISVGGSESVLVFSFVGTLTQELSVGDHTTLAVQLMPDDQTLSEVVVTGYGTQQKQDVTGAVGSIKSGEFNEGIINSPEQLIQGKVAGVNITSASGAPGATQSITIRGPGGIRTGSSPLFVVDGLALDNSETGGGFNPLNFINPQDIESIDVLKDASATAIYGSRGANGVILITTRRGGQGRSSVKYNTSWGVSQLARPLDVFTADEYRQQIVAVGGVLEDSMASTDWQEEISRSALTQNHNLTLTGAADKLTYYASLGLQDQEGVLKNSGMKRYSGRLNASQDFMEDRLHVDLNLNVAQTIHELPPATGGSGNDNAASNGKSIAIIGQAISANPTYPAYDRNGNPYQYQSGANPLRTLELQKNITKTTRIIGNISPSFDITKSLVYRLNFGIDQSNSMQDIQSLASVIPEQNGRLETIYRMNNNRLIENYLTLTHNAGDHDLSVLAGHSYQRFFMQRRANSINNFPITQVEPIYNPGIGQELTLANNLPQGSAVVNELQSFFGRVNYQWKGRYLATATVRADGSSKFGENNKYGVFPSFSLGWRIVEEPFLVSSGFVSDLKLRAGWGKTGNQEIPSKITQALFTSEVTSTTSYPLNENAQYPGGITYTRFANPDIQWEVSTQTNVGLDFGFFNGALAGSIDVFNKVSNNILLEVIPADPVQPATTVWANVEDMQIINRGLELSMNYAHTANHFSYSLGGNATFLRNRVENSPYSVISTGSASGSGLSSATVNGYINGEPIGTFLLQDHIGFDEEGLNVFRDINGDGLVNDVDRVAAGSALPTTQYNFFGNLSHRGWSLSFNVNGVSGNKVYDNTANANFYKLLLSKGLNTTPAAVANPEESVNNSAPVSTRYLKDGSFLRLNNVNLTYTFNTTALGIDRWVHALQLSLTGQNLWLLTDYDGYDPEVNTDRSSDGIASYGIDYLSYPKARTVMVGLNVTF